MKKAVIYIHGKGGSAREAEHYAPLFPGCEVIGFDYRAQTPWEARGEYRDFFETVRGAHDGVIVIANSLGAYFTLTALSGADIERAYFISPVVDMERLITEMMGWAGVSEQALEARGVIETNFGEALSWEYLSWVRQHPVDWHIPTAVLYGSTDNLQSIDTMRAFTQASGAKLTVMEGGEHWFHTDAQMAFLDSWLRENT